MTCSSCFAALAAAWKFCIYCGTEVAPAGNAPDEPPAVRNHLLMVGVALAGLGAVLLGIYVALKV